MPLFKARFLHDEGFVQEKLRPGPLFLSFMSSLLKNRLKQKRIIASLGIHDVFSARVAEQAGFEMLFMGGFGFSASLLGLPDLQLLTLTEMADAVRRVTSRVSVPVIADGDTGHGGVHNVERTVQEFEKAGASGVILEDQVSPKRCGHFDGKEIIPAREMVLKLKAALKSRRRRDFVLVARTDARDVRGLGEAIKRVRLYREAGADVVFIESPHSKDELRLIPKKVKAPLLVNMLTGGKTPNLPIPELEKMGYKIAVYPIETLLISAASVKALARSILEDGSVDKVRHRMVGFGEVKEILGLHDFVGRK